MAPDDEPRLQPLTRHLRDLGRDVSGSRWRPRVSMLQIQTRRPGAVGGLRRHPDPDSERSAPLVEDILDRGDPARDFELQKEVGGVDRRLQHDRTAGHQSAVALADAGLPVGVQFIDTCSPRNFSSLAAEARTGPSVADQSHRNGERRDRLTTSWWPRSSSTREPCAWCQTTVTHTLAALGVQADSE